MNEKNTKQPILGNGRFAPSPTGDFHIGNLRTALLAWACARSTGRGFHMRVEDLDERSRPEYCLRQLEDLAALGIDWDGPELYQSQRIDRYEEIFTSLLKSGRLYECYCTRKELASVASAPHRPPGSYPGTCRDLTESEREAGREKLRGTNREPALRLRTDALSGELVDQQLGYYCGAIDDLVIRRGDGVFSYNFVSVVDDAEYNVTQIVRGDDLLPSTPRQMHLQDLLGYPNPVYAHMPLILNQAGARLAKRDGAVTLRQLAELGWSSADIVELLASSLYMGEAGCATAGDVSAAVSVSVSVSGSGGTGGAGAGTGGAGAGTGGAGTGGAGTSGADMARKRSGIRDTATFLNVFDPAALPREPWRVNVELLAAGPAVWFTD
ncbi:tRNA glutamyl-Q(34) synthetase GluQRS [Arcanobacterium phocae]|uniref:tRNA glutamyl-Q(34) synthetase GluQRS n=1 Tax=Arcanobacterium phocae TaxID=131112 RepID=UPI001C0EF536|nr:tRNA glutamyl-Q(34) synthetase GluQRS [Arcanobacterium phocae]